jgi:hypothetical protein
MSFPRRCASSWTTPPAQLDRRNRAARRDLVPLCRPHHQHVGLGHVDEFQSTAPIIGDRSRRGSRPGPSDLRRDSTCRPGRISDRGMPAMTGR